MTKMRECTCQLCGGYADGVTGESIVGVILCESCYRKIFDTPERRRAYVAAIQKQVLEEFQYFLANPPEVVKP